MEEGTHMQYKKFCIIFFLLLMKLHRGNTELIWSHQSLLITTFFMYEADNLGLVTVVLNIAF